MKKLFFGLAALPFLAGVAIAGQSAPLTEAQMDEVTAGLAIVLVSPNNPPIFVGSGAAPGCTSPCVIVSAPNFDAQRGFPTVVTLP